MLEGSDNLSFTRKTLDKTGVVRQVGGHDLDRHVALDRRLIGAVNGCHAAFAQWHFQAVNTQRLSDQIGHNALAGNVLVPLIYTENARNSQARSERDRIMSLDQ